MITVIAYSDCQEVLTDDGEYILIKYTDVHDFAGYVYSVLPKPTHELRLRALNFHDRFQQSSENDELSNGVVVKLSSTLKPQRLITIEPVPYHLAEIINEAFMHNYVEVDGVRYTKEENVEVRMLNQRYPLCTVEVVLTKYDGFIFNTFAKT